MSTPPQGPATGLDASALEPIAAAVESGAGLPAVLRAAARALDASLVLSDRSGSVLAVAARSPADEQSLLADAAGVRAISLRVADELVGVLRMRSRNDVDEGLLRIVAMLIGSEAERVRAPALASAEALTAFVSELLAGDLDRGEIVGRGRALDLDLSGGAAVLVARAHSLVTVEDGWRTRVQAVVERGARSAVARAVACPSGRDDAPGAEVVVLLPGADDGAATRGAEGVLSELQASLPGHTFAVGRSRATGDPLELQRAGSEALLAANVAEGLGERPLLAFEETGAYRLLLSAMSEDADELQRFYAETVEPLVVYDEQYETGLIATVEAFLDADGNVAATAQRLFTHRHTIRYRLERVRELSGLDVGSTDGRERLSLGLKAMRVLGIAHRRGPASELGAAAGRVPRRA